jgi:hypothetical protein
MLNSRRSMRVLYYAPDTHTPSWGVGMLYTHVKLLGASGFDAAVLHETTEFRPSWLDIEVPHASRKDARQQDIVVVPEVFAAEADALRVPCRRIVFVQASSFIEPGLRGAKDYRELGYSGAIAIMPHVREIVERHYGVKAPVIPPCVAPYFFLSGEKRDRPRRLQVVLYPKTWCRDLPIVRQMLLNRTRALAWRIVELENKTHREAARVLRQAALHVNVNCQESFNATVPEAMAAGCIPICYEAFGGKDYLRDGKNAYVFPTHHAYPLVEQTLDLMDSWDSRQRELQGLRAGGLATVRRYTEAVTKEALIRYFSAAC